ncbi:hypothetical protein [Paraburkholderia sp. GAS334]|uniref:hypothetical protein n=1 Tax=Paraburkholderia sp. GAS334 TaxID=3035131 RepID=UPI003D1E3A38
MKPSLANDAGGNFEECLAVSQIIAGVEPRCAAVAPTATALVATSVVATALLTSVLSAVVAPVGRAVGETSRPPRRRARVRCLTQTGYGQCSIIR